MSDSVAASAYPGSAISPREIGTVRFRVAGELPRPGLPQPGAGLAWWPWGEVRGWIFGLGPVVKNAEIAEWEQTGLLLREGGR